MPSEPFPVSRVAWCCAGVLGVWVLYVYGLDALGVVGPDEPRYAAIARAMAASGDWITPRLWGAPWFEKPALLYWMAGAGFRSGLGPEWAPRLPIALLSVAFLIGYWALLRRAFGFAVAWCATVFLGTSAGWLAFSQVAVTDLPLAATSAAAMLLVLDLLPDRVPGLRRLSVAALLLGLAVLAKGLVPLVLALPALWVLRRHWRRLLHPAPLLVFCATVLPWYVLCWIHNGNVFLEVFFLQHQLGRFTSDALQHVQPFWYYGPVLLAGLFPWTLLLIPVFRRSVWDDERTRYLVLWFVFGFLFFSVSRNKLPGYLLPLLPALCALLGVAVMRTRVAAPLFALTCLLLMAGPLALILAPVMVNSAGRGVSPIPEAAALQAALLLPVAFLLAATTYFLDGGGKRRTASIAVIGIAVCGIVFAAKRWTLPAIDAAVTPRALWLQVKDLPAVCAGPIHRAWRYGLNYYSVIPLPDCAAIPAPVHIVPGPRHPVLSTSPK